MHIKTIILALAIGSFVFGFVLILFQYREERSQRIPYWVAAKFLQGTGSLLLYYRDVMPEFMGILVANSLLLSGCAYEGWAVFHITGRAVRRGMHVFATFCIIAGCFTMLYLNPPNRIAMIFFIHTIFYALPGWALLQHAGEKSPLRSALGYSFILLALIFFIRSLWACFVPEQSHILFGTMIYQVMLPALYCMMLISGFSMLLLAKEKSDRELHESLKEQRVQQDMLVRQKAELESAQYTKNRFLKMVAHEFRTPLGLLASSVDIMDRYWERLTEAERRVQNSRIRSATQQITSLTDSILSYDHSGTTEYETSPIEVQVGALCRKIAVEAETVWSRGHEFQLSIAKNCGTALLDETLFRRVVQNLLSNAFSYTEPTGRVSLMAKRIDNKLLIEISDSGIGITEADQRHIFDSYFRGHNIGTRRGLGLGLSIVQETLAMMRGSIQLSSEIGKGTSMSVEIPLVMVNS